MGFGLFALARNASAASPAAPVNLVDDLKIGPGARFFLEPAPMDGENKARKHDEGEGDESGHNGPGLVYSVGLWGTQWNKGMKPGRGEMDMNIRGPAFPGFCSVHGPGAIVLFGGGEFPSGSGNVRPPEWGNNPYPDIQCGRGFGNDISLDHCQATLSFHGYVHSDRVGEAYLGSTTADVRFRKTGPTTGTLRVDIYTPKTAIVLEGRVDTGERPIVMSSCP
jgi:hypothetical protein